MLPLVSLARMPVQNLMDAINKKVEAARNTEAD